MAARIPIIIIFRLLPANIKAIFSPIWECTGLIQSFGFESPFENALARESNLQLRNLKALPFQQ